MPPTATAAALALWCALSGAPARPDPLAAARRELAVHDFWSGMALAELAVRTAPDSPEAISLLAAACEVSGDPRARALRARAGPARTPPPPPVTSFKAGDRAFAAAGSVALHRDADPSSPVLASLPGNAGVEVLAASGGWVRTRWRHLAPGRRHVLTFAGGQPAAPAAGSVAELQGWIHAGSLSPAALDPAALSTSAEAAALAGRREDALRDLRLALAARPRSERIRERLVRTALDLGYDALAARTAWEDRLGDLVVETIEIEALDVYYGCRGDRQRAAVIRDLGLDRGLRRIPRDACVAYVDVRPSCDDHERRLARWKQKLDAAFPRPHWLRIAFANRRPTDLAELWVLRDDSPGPTCGDALDWGAPEEARRIELPPVAAGASVDLWLEIPAYLGQRFRLSTSPHGEDAVAEAITPDDITCEATLECD